MTTIARIQYEDLPALANLYQQFWGEESSLHKMKQTFTRLVNNENYILLSAKRDNALIGSVLGIVCEELYGECQPFMVVEDVIVDSAYRRGGVGSLLMKKLEREAAKRHCGYIIFVTESKRKDAIDFYGSLGYQLEGYQGFKKRIGR